MAHRRPHAPEPVPGAPQHAAIPLRDAYCVSCVEQLEAALRRQPGIASAHVDLGDRVLHVAFDPAQTSEPAVRELIDASRRCACEDGAAPNRGMQAGHLGHRADMAPVAMGTAHDRMQYELPSTGAHEEHESRHAAAMQHAGMEHDMSGPRMARAMEADMRDRFFVALVLTVPVVLYSPLATDFFNLDLPTGAIPRNWLLLALTTPVVWWAGWIFIGGAARSLRHRMLNMSVLVATGVLAAWGFSVVITAGGLGETFFEAAAMLVTFVLFGHWMEMKSRRGTTDALRALFDLVPPRATVIRDGREVDLPTSEIIAGDRIVLRPGDRVPVDGIIESGATAIDEALVTGESVPKEKAPGDELIGGSINRTGSVTFRATKVGADTALAQIVKLVEDAQSSKAPGQRLADRAAQYLVLLALGSGAVTFVAWYAIAGETALLS